MTLRALVSTKDAGVIIGKAGKNVAELREQTGVKAGVSKVIPGVHERVLTVTGSVEGVAKVREYMSVVDRYLILDVGVLPHCVPTRLRKPLLSRHLQLFFADHRHPSPHLT